MITIYANKNALLKWLVIFCSLITPTLSNAMTATNNNKIAIVELEQKSSDTLNEIKQLIGTASCDDNNQCRTLAIGHRACGGPAAYLAYSLKNGLDENKLSALARQHTSTERELNRLKEIISTCDMLMPPPVNCDAGKCVIQ